MITVCPATEFRTRDVKRKRVLLSIGEKSWHLSNKEAKRLSEELAETLKILEHRKVDNGNG